MSEQETETVEQTAVTADDMIVELITKFDALSKEVKETVSQLKTIRKAVAKQTKKKTKRTVTRDPNAPPSGFNRPTEISSELAEFLGTPAGELVARTYVTRHINKYVKEHGLQREDNKRVIDLSKEGGAPLQKLLNPPSDVELTFFNLQTYLKGHYPKKSVVSADTPASAPVVTAPVGTTKAVKDSNVSKVKDTKVSRTARARRVAKA